MSLGAVRAMYNLALPPLLLAALPAQWLKMRRRGGTPSDLKERLGLIRPTTAARLAALEKPWWIHAVSVGEALVAVKFIDAVRARRPDLPLVLSTTTTTGFAVATRELPPDVPVIYNPVDLPGTVRRAFDTVRPGRLVLVEAEIWPNLVHEAHASGLEVALINARLSPRSERRYRAARPLVAPLLAQLDRVMVPEPEDVDRWSAIGVRPEMIHVTGSLKHDYEGLPDDPRAGSFRAHIVSLWGNPPPLTLLAASTHPGEESLIARHFLALRTEFPALRLLVVPRHVERSAAVAAELAALGLAVVRRSHLPDASSPARTATARPDVLLIDTTGELRAWYPLATVVVIGKSFLSQGGQNPVEALMAGRPVVTGPHMENFAPLMHSLLTHQAVIQAPEATSLGPILRSLIASPAETARLVAAARTALAPHQGATLRTADLLLNPHP